jgi:hypothetical protein
MRCIAIIGAAAMVCVAAWAASGARAWQAADADAPAHTLADIAWMTGHWSGGREGELCEEVWTAAHAGSMTGLFRWFRGDRLIVHELLLLEEREGRVEMRLRHFGASMRAFEEAPLVFHLTSLDEHRAVFSQREPEAGTTLTYERPTDEGVMRFTFEQAQEGAEPRRFTLAFQRKP